jgi:hypothetical protein
MAKENTQGALKEFKKSSYREDIKNKIKAIGYGGSREEVSGKIYVNQPIIEISAETLYNEKCMYTIIKKDSEEEKFFGKLSQIETLSDRPEIEVALRNAGGETKDLLGTLYGNPEQLKVYLPKVSKIE